LEQATQLEIERRTDAAMSAAADYYGAEISRLQYLQRINPAVRGEEIAALTEESKACQTALSHSKPALEGLRVCIAV
jgi:ATP-dependent helicase HepA